MISKTQISKRLERKRNPLIIEAVSLAKKSNQLEIAKRLSGPSRLYKQINLDELNKVDSKKVLVIGKVLGSGDITKKMQVSALGYSKQAKEKLIKAGCEVLTVKDSLQKKSLEGVEVLW